MILSIYHKNLVWTIKINKQIAVYSYEYMDIFKEFFDEKLPDRCEFFSSPKDECISGKDYLHVIDIWNVFKMNTMGDYHDFWSNILAHVFENVISKCLEYYWLDPCHYFSSLGLSCNAMLKMTGMKFQLISDIDMHWFIEKGMREGISYIAKRYSKANNK